MPGRDAELRSINCTECGAPLTLHGGHKVRSITCAYCGSVLDARDEFRVVRKFLDRNRPPTPFELGMTGTVAGVEFTVIGLLQYQSEDFESWIELLLFSPTHGYAWLEQANGHFVFSRRVRHPPSPRPRPKTRFSFEAAGRRFRVFSWYSAKVVYVEGELTWVAKAGDTVRVLEAISPPHVYCVERTGREEEYSLGEYLAPGPLFEAFGVPNDPPRPRTVHPAQPFAPGPIFSGLHRAGLIFAPVALALALLTLVAGRGTVRLEATVPPEAYVKGVHTAPFQVADPEKLLGLELSSPLDNAWAAFNVGVRRGEQEIFSMAKQISYYHGVEGGESWSEGSRSAKVYFKVPDAGTYDLFIVGEGGTGRSGRRPQARPLRVQLREGVIVSRYFIGLLVLTAVALAARTLRSMVFEHRRWSDSGDE